MRKLTLRLEGPVELQFGWKDPLDARYYCVAPAEGVLSPTFD